MARPPPKYVHDIALLVRQATGYLPAMPEEWPEPREAKLDLLQHIADSTAATLGLATVTFDPADVLKGKEVSQTLQLLQLLAVAAAKHSQQPSGGNGKAKVHRDRRKTEGKTRASAMVPILEAVKRFLQVIVDQQAQRRRDELLESGHASPTRELESSVRALQERLEEEMQLRRRQEERLHALQQEVVSARALLQEHSVKLEEARSAAVDADTHKAELRQEIEQLRVGLLGRAQQVEGNPEVAHMRQEFQKLTITFHEHNDVKARLGNDVKLLQQQQLETDTQRETMEMEVKRMRLRMAEGLDGPPPMSQSEDLLLLQAEKQKWSSRVSALEEALRSIAEAEDAERQREAGLVEEKKIQSMKNDDVQLQLQVVIEDREGLRDGMDLLWQEKTRAEEELENVSQGYMRLSDRLMEKSEEYRELEERLQQYENLLLVLQENFEKSRHSPVLEHVRASKGGHGAAAAKGGAGHGSRAAGGTVGDGEGSSHYSDDDFEEPDED